MALRTAGTTPRRLGSPTPRWWRHPDNIIIALALVLTVATATTLRLPAKTPPLTIVNGSALSMSLEVRSADDSGWMGLGTFTPGPTTVHQVIDQGDSWLVRARVGPHIAEPFAVSRTELRAEDWELTVPDAVTESLRREGAEPEP